jgi:hypothetical protein
LNKSVRAVVARRCQAIRNIKGIGDAFAHLPVVLLALVISLLLRLRLSRLVFKWLRSVKARPGAPSEQELETIVRRTDAVLLLGRPLIRSECLSRSCVLYYQMRRAGADVDIRIGVRNDGQRLRFHSWVLVNGAPTYEHFDPNVEYKGFYNLSDQKAS